MTICVSCACTCTTIATTPEILVGSLVVSKRVVKVFISSDWGIIIIHYNDIVNLTLLSLVIYLLFCLLICFSTNN